MSPPLAPTAACTNSVKNSTLGVDAINSRLPSIKASSPGRDSWEATPSGRAGGEGGAVAPAAVDAADRTGARRALSSARDASRAATFRCSTSSSWRRRRTSHRGTVAFASLSARLARATSEAKAKWVTAWVLRSRKLWGWCSVERGESRWRRWCSVERGEASWRCSPGLARAGAETSQSLVEVVPLPLCEPASRHDRLVCFDGAPSCCPWCRRRIPRPEVLPVSSREMPSVSPGVISSVPFLSLGPPGWRVWRTAACPSNLHRRW